MNHTNIYYKYQNSKLHGEKYELIPMEHYFEAQQHKQLDPFQHKQPINKANIYQQSNLYLNKFVNPYSLKLKYLPHLCI